MKTLYLPIKKKWFDMIARGTKDTEYRGIKKYWYHRLYYGYYTLNPEPIKFDEVHFRNGYTKNSPFMRVKWKATQIRMWDDKRHFAIQLGKILEIKNWRKNENNTRMG